MQSWIAGTRKADLVANEMQSSGQSSGKVQAVAGFWVTQLNMTQFHQGVKNHNPLLTITWV